MLNVTQTSAFKAWVDGVAVPPKTVTMLQIVYASLPPLALAILFHAMTYIIEHGIAERDIVTCWKTRLQRARRGMASIRKWYGSRLQAAETKRQELEIALQAAESAQQQLSERLQALEAQNLKADANLQQIIVERQKLEKALQEAKMQLQAANEDLQHQTTEVQFMKQQLQDKNLQLAEATKQLQAIEKVLSRFGPEGLAFIRMVAVGDVNQSELAGRMPNVSAPMLSKVKAACNGGSKDALEIVAHMGHA